MHRGGSERDNASGCVWAMSQELRALYVCGIADWGKRVKTQAYEQA